MSWQAGCYLWGGCKNHFPYSSGGLLSWPVGCWAVCDPVDVNDFLAPVCAHMPPIWFWILALEVEPLEKTMILQKSNVCTFVWFSETFIEQQRAWRCTTGGVPFLWRNIQLTWGSGGDMKWKSTLFCTRFVVEPWMFANSISYMNFSLNLILNILRLVILKYCGSIKH